MSGLSIRRAESPTKPELEDLQSLDSTTSSMSKGSTETPLENDFLRNHDIGRISFCEEDDPILNNRSEAGGTDWSLEQQEEFIAHLLLHTDGNQFSDEEISLIRTEVEQAGIPVECVDRLLEQHKNQQQLQELSLKKHTNEDLEMIEDVDESDNIQAYFSRMATLKQGGHFPSLNTEAIQPFVENDDCTEDVEVDLDVGYVNKSLDLSLDEDIILQGDSWIESDDGSSQGSTAVDFRNAYNTINAFESLLIKNESQCDEAEEEDEDDLETTDKVRKTADQLDIESAPKEDDWAPQVVRPSRTYRYGYEHDLEEWKRRTKIALWKPSSQNKSNFFSCQVMAEAVVSDELNGLLWGGQRPPRLQGMRAVRKLLNEARVRRERQHNRNQHRHVPDEIAAAPRPWQLPYRERCRPSQGYLGVDMFSLMDSAAAMQPLDSRDDSTWESRDVRQHFLHERSISLSRNWFGRLRRKRGNDPNKYRPCRPNTMGMPTEPSSETTSTPFDDGEWTDAPSKTNSSKSWKSRGGNSEVNRTASLSFSSGEASCQSPSRSNDDHDCVSSSTQSHSVPDCSTSSRYISHDDDASSFHGQGNRKKKIQVNFGSMMTSLISGSDAFSHSRLQESHGYGIPWISEDEFDTDRFGVGSILGHDEDRYISSFSETFSDSHSSDSDDSSSTASSGSFVTEDSTSTSSESEETWEDNRECGTFVNVKPKLGERVSRLTPDHTSHLLRSRFRKKYTQKGSLFDV